MIMKGGITRSNSLSTAPRMSEEMEDSADEEETELQRYLDYGADSPGPSDTDHNPYFTTVSPETVITEYPTKPDITLFCDICNIFVDLRLLKEHRQYHKALLTMLYEDKTRPKTVAELVTRRLSIIKTMKINEDPQKPIMPQDVQVVNDAFETLKSDLEDTIELCRRVQEEAIPNVSGFGLNCTPNCALAVGVSSDQNARWKNKMEDTHVFQDHYGSDRKKSFFGVFDGHNGRFAADMAANQLHHMLLQEIIRFDPDTKDTCSHNQFSNEEIPKNDGATKEIHKVTHSSEKNIEKRENLGHGNSITAETKKKDANKQKKFDPFAEKMGDAFKKAYATTDHLLLQGKEEESRVRWSGCSALTCVLQDLASDIPEEIEKSYTGGRDREPIESPRQLGMLHLANAGNVHAVLVRDNKTYRLSRDHTSKNKKEKNRVIKEGGRFNVSDRDQRLNGIMATTRGLGNHGDPALKKCVINEPYMTSIPIDQFAQCLIMASDGLWELFSDKEVASLVLQLLPGSQVPAPSRLSVSLNLLWAELNCMQANLQTSSLPYDLNRKMSATGIQDQDKNVDAIGTTETKISGSSRKSGAKVVISGKVNFQAPPVEHGENQQHEGSSVAKGNLHGDDNKNHSNNDNRAGYGIQNDNSHGSKKYVQKTLLSHHGSTSNCHGNQNHHDDDLRTEAGSHIGSCEESSEHDGDIEHEDNLSIPIYSRPSSCAPSQDDVRREYAKSMAEHLVQAALLGGSKNNITVMVILLPGSGL